MQVVIELTDEQRKRLDAFAQPLGLTAEALAQAVLVDTLELSAADFEEAAAHVLSKNAELYRRLA